MGKVTRGLLKYKKICRNAEAYKCIYIGTKKIWCGVDIITYSDPAKVGEDLVGNNLDFSSGTWGGVGDSPIVFTFAGSHPSWMSINQTNGNLVGTIPHGYKIYNVVVRGTKGLVHHDSRVLRVGNLIKFNVWRLHVTSNFSATNASISMSTLRVYDVNDNDMLQNSDFSHFVDHGSKGGEPISNLIDNNETTNWASSEGGHKAFIEMHFTKQVGISHLNIVGRNDAYADSGPHWLALDFYAMGRWKPFHSYEIKPSYVWNDTSRHVEFVPH